MGHGIAQVAAQAGIAVRIQDALPGGAKGAIDRIAKNLAKGVELGKLAATDRDAALARLSAFDELAAAVGEADIVIEAVPEKIELKRESSRSSTRSHRRTRSSRRTRRRCRSASSRTI